MRRALSFAEYGRLRDALKLKHYLQGIERETIRIDCERILGKSVSMSTVGKLCKELGIIYKYSPRGSYLKDKEDPIHGCPACGSRIRVKLYR